MDIDRFIVANQPEWDRLRRLAARARGNPARLSAAELDELVSSYQRVSTHLSLARTRLSDPGLEAALTRLVAQAGTVVYGTRPRTWGTVIRFVTDTFPAAVWHARIFVVIATALFLVPATALATWLANSPAALEMAAPPALRQAYIASDFEEYYSSQPSAQFASVVTTNNIQVSILAFAGGVLVCVPTVYVMVINGAHGGVAAGLFAAAGQQAKFWGLVLPHGLLELTAVFIAGGAGLRLGWTLVDPGDRPRAAALTEEGRRAVVIVVGLVVVFAVAGLIEGFITGSALPTSARVGVGVAAWSLFCGYVVARGRAAARRGLTGALEEQAMPAWAAPKPAATGGRLT